MQVILAACETCMKCVVIQYIEHEVGRSGKWRMTEHASELNLSPTFLSQPQASKIKGCPAKATQFMYLAAGKQQINAMDQT